MNRAHFPTFPSLHLRHSSFSNPSIASPTSQFILQPFFSFSYVTSSSFRPGADQSSKATFGKSAFAKTCFLLLKIRLAHINLAKSKNAFEHVLAGSSLVVARAKTCSKVLLLFARLVCTSHIFNKRNTYEHVLAKALLPKAALLDWSAPGLKSADGLIWFWTMIVK